MFRMHAFIPFLALVIAAIASAAPLKLAPELFVSGLQSPGEIAHAGDSSGRLFVAELGGRVRVIRNRQLLATPFLDLSPASGGPVLSGGEQGLLGLAFHPDYEGNGRFFVFYTRALAGDAAGNEIVIARYLRSATDPDAADPSSGQVVMTIAHPGQSNHNGGKIAFGPGGYLYIGVGDGGGGGDPFNAAQSLSDLRGKILRIDVDGGSPYAIPADNPFAGSADPSVRKEIWAYGLRNPWRFSFDRATGDLFIGDVGQGAREEIDLESAGSPGGRNYGWSVYEGTHCYRPATGCSLAGHVPPIIEYGHDAVGGRSVTGGFRYRGRNLPGLAGRYVYGDFVSGRIWAATPDGAGTWSPAEVASIPFLSTFGEDELGEIYAANLVAGALYLVTPVADGGTDLDGDGKSDILYRNFATGQVYRFLADGLSLASGALAFTEPNLAWRIVADADFNGDGVTDLLWRNRSTGQLYLMPFSDAGMPEGGQVVYTEPNTSWEIVHATDINGDGRADILYWNHDTGQVYALLMEGTAIGTHGFVYTEPDTAWQIVAVGDFAGSGKKNQLLWRNAATGQVYLMTVTVSGGAFSQTGQMIYQEANTAWRIVGAADFNGDGKTDIAWGNVSTGQVYLMLMNGAAIASEGLVYAEPDWAWKIVALGDYNGDGKADLLWRNYVTGQVYMMLMDGLSIGAQGMVFTEPDTDWRILGPQEYVPNYVLLPDEGKARSSTLKGEPVNVNRGMDRRIP